MFSHRISRDQLGLTAGGMVNIDKGTVLAVSLFLFPMVSLLDVCFLNLSILHWG